jgi:hypothetical protein
MAKIRASKHQKQELKANLFKSEKDVYLLEKKVISLFLISINRFFLLTNCQFLPIGIFFVFFCFRI